MYSNRRERFYDDQGGKALELKINAMIKTAPRPSKGTLGCYFLLEIIHPDLNF